MEKNNIRCYDSLGDNARLPEPNHQITKILIIRNRASSQNERMLILKFDSVSSNRNRTPELPELIKALKICQNSVFRDPKCLCNLCYRLLYSDIEL